MYVLMLIMQRIKIQGLIRFSLLEGMCFGSRRLSLRDLDIGLVSPMDTPLVISKPDFSFT